MNGMKHIYLFAMLLATLLATSCADDDRQAADAIPDGYGKLTVTISTPEAAKTRAVSTTTPWLQGSLDERAIKSYHLLVCNGNTIVQAISGGETELGDHEADPKNYFPSAGTITTDILPIGTYNFTFYCLANFTPDMLTATGLAISNGKVTDTELPANFETKVMQPIANGIDAVPSTGLPMTGKLTQSSVNISKGEITTIGNPLILWRMMAKMEFYFTNQSDTKIRIKGVEVEPINQATAANGSGIYLISQDNLGSLANLRPQSAGASTSAMGVTATWPLHDNVAVNAVVSETGVLVQATLSNGSSLTASGQLVAQNLAVTKLQKFKAKQDIPAPDPNHDPPILRDDQAYVTFTVKPVSGITFKPTHLSFKASRGGANDGQFDVEAVSGSTNTVIASEVNAARYDEEPYLSSYEYTLNADAITNDGAYTIKIYLYNLKENEEFALSDVVITGIATQNIAGATATEGVTLPSGALTDVGTFEYQPSSALELAAGANTHTPFFFYVNETDATFTTTNNQLSLRFKIQRWNAATSQWNDDEIRYGVTTHYGDGTTGHDGFNVIRRNDWIHIPVVLTDWQFRIEPLAFVPIAGYPATTVSSDGLTATFSTGGMIALQPFVKKYDENTWRSFGDPEISDISISWKNQSGSENLVTTPFIYDPVTKSIIGELNNNLGAGTYKTSITVNATLGPTNDATKQYPYSYTFNVVLQK